MTGPAGDAPQSYESEKMSRLRHDIDNNIHVALGNAELLLLEEPSPSARAALEDISAAITSVQRLLDEAFRAVGPDASS